MSAAKKLLMQGLCDAAGFLGGALGGYWIGALFGLNLFDTGYSNGTLVAIVLVGLGGGAGLQLARYLYAKRHRSSK